VYTAKRFSESVYTAKRLVNKCIQLNA